MLNCTANNEKAFCFSAMLTARIVTVEKQKAEMFHRVPLERVRRKEGTALYKVKCLKVMQNEFILPRDKQSTRMRPI